ncbi:hypothetical protein D0O09_12835 [Pseudomonas putida]|nr:hypothetical protein D0O09_12835 [Pseudomonas putida]
MRWGRCSPGSPRPRLKIAGAAVQPFRDARPLPQCPRRVRELGLRGRCGSGLASRKGRAAAPAIFRKGYYNHGTAHPLPK